MASLPEERKQLHPEALQQHQDTSQLQNRFGIYAKFWRGPMRWRTNLGPGEWINRGGSLVLVEGRKKLLKCAANPLLQGIHNQTESKRIDFAFKSTRNV